MEGDERHTVWYPLPSEEATPPARAAHGAVVISDVLFLFGGWNGKNALNDFFMFDFRKRRWANISNAQQAPTATNNHAVVAVGTHFFAHGGHDGVTWTSELSMVDVSPALAGEARRLRWDKPPEKGQKPVGRACHSLSHIGERLFVFGGFDGEQCFNDIEVFNLMTFEWTRPEIRGPIPEARNAHAMAVVGPKLVLFGGHTGRRHLADVHVFDSELFTWVPTDVWGPQPPGLRGHSANVVGSKILVFGGYDGRSRQNKTYVLSLEESQGYRWEALPEELRAAPVGRQRHVAVVRHPKQLFVFGGFDGRQWLRDFCLLDVSKLERLYFREALCLDATTKFASDIKGMLTDTAFTDVTLVVGDEEFPAHRNILAARCTYFQRMFTGGMAESQSRKISIEGFSATAFGKLLEFFYSGRFFEDNFATMQEMLSVADCYGLDDLKTICQKSLVDVLDDGNVFDLLRLAHRYSASLLKNRCLEHIVQGAEVTDSEWEQLKDIPDLAVDLARLQHTRQSSARILSARSMGPASDSALNRSLTLSRKWPRDG